MDAITDHASEGMLAVSDDWRVLAANRAARRLLDRDRLVGHDVREVFPPPIEASLYSRFDPTGTNTGPSEPPDGATTSGLKAGNDPPEANGGTTPVREGCYEEYVPSLERWLAVRTVDDGDRTYVYLEDVTDWKRRERELEERRDQLSTLSRINGLVGDLMGTLVGASDRTDVETTVCERLTESELFPLAFVLERDPTTAGVRVSAVAGGHDSILDSVTGAAERGEGLEWAALDTGDPGIVTDLPASDRVPEPVRRAAFATGLQSAAAVPLTYGETVHGVLGVYSTRPEAFAEQAGDGFVALGSVVGFAITAARQRNLLLSDTLVELTFRVDAAGSVLAAVSSHLDCALRVEGVVPVSEDRLLCYVDVTETPAGTVERAIRERTDAGTRTIYDHENGGLVEVTLTGGSPLVVLSGAGGVVAGARFDAGTGRVTAAVGPDEDVRKIVSRVAETAPESELVAKRQSERAVETVQEFRSVLHDRLTDRQRTALRTAYYGDYFESPRGSTAEDLAAVLDVTSPTFHHHLRAAQAKLFDALFSDPREVRSDR